MHKRKDTFEISEEEQLRTLSSPAAMEIIRVLRHSGPCSVSELGPKLGKKPNSLQYHIRKLKNAGLVVVTEKRRSGKRPERVYDVTADKFIGKAIHKSEGLSRLANETVASLCRLATRDFKRSPRTELDSESHEKLAIRLTARLTEKDRAQVKELIGELESVFAKRVGREDGDMFALTLVQTPLNED